MLGDFCFTMIGRADIEGSKSNVAMNAWLPQASYPCDTSCSKPLKSKGSIGYAFTICIRTEYQNQVSFCPLAPCEVSVHAELTEAQAARPDGAAAGADLGGSSKYLNGNFEGRSGEWFHVNSS